MDFTNASVQAVRAKVMNGAQESGVPANPSKDTLSRLTRMVRTTVEFSYNLVTDITKTVAKAIRLS